MARYEFKEGSSNKFWEIEVSGKSFKTTWGKIGANPTFQTKNWPDEETAQKEADKLVNSKVKKGYKPVGGAAKAAKADEADDDDGNGAAKAKAKPKAKAPASKAATNPALEKAIFKNPDDVDAYLVYADWLQSNGDPRGELIVMQQQALAAKDKAKASELKKAANALIKKHAEHFLGPLANKEYKIEWRLGFIHKAEIGGPAFGYDLEEGAEGTEGVLVADLKELLAHPSGRFLQELELGPVPGEDEMSVSALVDVLKKLTSPLALRSFYLGHVGEWDISSTNGMEFDGLSKIMPQLRTLVLHGGSVSLGKGIDLPELRELRVETGGLSKGEIKNICAAKWPKLEKLSIYFGDEERGASGGINDIAPILAGTGLSKVTHLGLMNCDWVDEICVALGMSKLAPKLESLDLSLGCMTKRGADALLRNKSVFKKLKTLNVSENFLPEDCKKTLKPLAEELVFKDMKGDGSDDYRYVSMSE